MSKKSQQNKMNIYLLHRECVRRNHAYVAAYHQIHTIDDADKQAVELVELATQWGLSMGDDLPNPSKRPGYIPKQLMKDDQLSISTLLDGPMQTDSVEMDAALIVQEHLSKALSTLSQELNGFMVLLHLPEEADQRLGFDVIDLRRPKEEILLGVQQLIDDARDPHTSRLGNKRRQSLGGPKTKGFDYLKVYDLHKQGRTFREIANELRWEAGLDSEKKASRYYKQACAMIENPPLLRMVDQQLAHRRQKRTFAKMQRLPSRSLLWGKRAWLRPAPIFHRQSA